MTLSKLLRLILTVLLFTYLAATGRAGGPCCVDAGWVVSSTGSPYLTSGQAATYVAGKTGWLRIEFRLVNGNTSWNSTMLGYYDTVINNARAAGLQVVGLVDNTSWNGGQGTWNSGNHENNSGTNGDTSYVDNYATNAVAVIVNHFHDRIKIFEIWNEPSTWSTHSGSTYSGASYVYPSIYSWMLNKSWYAVHIASQINDVKLITGGIFGTSDTGASDPGGNSGSNWLAAVYATGISVGSFASSFTNTYGSYPLDGIGQHLYIDYNITTSAADIQQYLNLVRGAYTKYEGSGTPKQTYVTEFGWSTANVSQSVQAANLTMTFSTFNVGGSGSYVALASWFNWGDSASLFYGLFDSTGTAKTAYADYQFEEQYEGYYSNGTLDNNILTYFNAHGQGQMGDAFNNGGTAFVHSWSGQGNGAIVQDYTGGSHHSLTIFDNSSSTYEINDVNGFWSFYLASGGIGWFGAPKNNEFASGGGTRQDCWNGYFTQDTNGIVWHATALQGEYFSGTNFNTLKMKRLDTTVNYNWGTNSPDPSLPADLFSVRWTGTVTPLYSETYTFYTDTDDGSRLYVNGTQLVNDWTVHALKEDSGTITLTAGVPYTIEMDYFENTQGAQASLLWSSASQAKQVIPASQLTSPMTGLYADYYNGTNFNSHVLAKIDPTVNYTWNNAPASFMGKNCYSVQWSGTVTPLYTETYTFYTDTDDGARLWVNGTQLVNDWTVHGTTERSGTITLTAGVPVSIVMQYFQNTGGAVAQLQWSSTSQAKQVIPASQLLP